MQNLKCIWSIILCLVRRILDSWNLLDPPRSDPGIDLFHIETVLGDFLSG